jgi:hypothetical protein
VIGKTSVDPFDDGNPVLIDNTSLTKLAHAVAGAKARVLSR